MSQVARRLSVSILLLWLVATATFFVVQAAPGSYVDTIDASRLPPEAREQIRHRYGLDRPIHEQYLSWLRSLAAGDLGVSFHYRMPVTRVLATALPPTLLLAGTALVLDLTLGLALALAAVRRPFGWFDRFSSVFGLVLYGLPSFWIAGLAILIFALMLGWFPASHMHSVHTNTNSSLASLLDVLHHLVLPACCLGIVGAAATARYLRASLLELRGSTFLLACRARGLPRWRILWLHALRPALLPVVTMIGLSIPVLFSGSVVIEVVFSWPGMGRVLWEAAVARDVPVIMGATVVGACGVILGNLFSDILYTVVDPRTRESR
ncbi:MAG: ABC transporter permease [bacterium]|nr:ABC transporter permease [bacterium]